MSIDGRINVDCLFHDKDGTASLKVVSLQESTAYTTGKVAIITGTVGTAQTTIAVADVYKNAAGDAVTIGESERVMFSYKGAAGFARRLELVDFDDFAFARIVSRDDQISTSTGTNIDAFRITASAGNTGTYRIVIFGDRT